MKTNHYFFILLIPLFMYSCKSSISNNNHTSPLKTITDSHLKRRIFDTSRKDNVDELLVKINVYSPENIARNSTHILNIYLYYRTKFKYRINDSIYSYKGLEVYFEDTDPKYKKLFDTEFKYLVTDDVKKKKEKESSIISGAYNDPIFEMTIYFNKENEITYIDPGLDQYYYDLLKDKIKFSDIFIEKLK